MDGEDLNFENLTGIEEISVKTILTIQDISELEFDILLLDGLTTYEDSIDKYWAALWDLKDKASCLVELYLQKQKAKEKNYLKYSKDENNIIRFEIIRPVGEPNFLENK